MNIPLAEGESIVYGTTSDGYSGPLIRKESISGDFQYVLPGGTYPYYENPQEGEPKVTLD